MTNVYQRTVNEFVCPAKQAVCWSKLWIKMDTQFLADPKLLKTRRTLSCEIDLEPQLNSIFDFRFFLELVS